MWRLILSTLFAFHTGWVADAQLQFEKVHYAVLELHSYSAGPYPNGYWEEKARLENKEARLKNPTHKDEDDIIIVSNSCGQEIETWNVVLSSKKMPDRITVTSGIGEWCRLPSFNLREQFFAIFEKGEAEPVERFPIYETDGGEAVLLIEDEVLEYLKEDELVPHHINYKTFKDPIGAPDFYNAYDPRVQSDVAKTRHMKIMNFEDSDRKRVVFFRAIPLSAFFPEPKEADTPE